MSERTTLQTMLGAALAVSANLPATFNAAGYTASAVVFTSVGQVENYGNHGMTAAVTPFTPVDTGVVFKMKGSKDYGAMQLVIGNLPSDAGQDILAAAAESANRYSIKITYPLGNAEATPETHYLDVIVSSFAFQDGAVNDARKINVTLDLCRAPTIVAAT
jgi:hypothetical protein